MEEKGKVGFLSVLDARGRSPGARDPPGGTDDLQLGPMAVLELVLVPVAGAASLEPRPAPSQDRAQRAKANTTTPGCKSRTECVYWQSRSYEVQTAARLAGHLSGETCPSAAPLDEGRGRCLRSCAAAALV